MADEKWTSHGDISAVEAEIGSVCLPLNPEFVRQKIKDGEGWVTDYGEELRELLVSKAAEYPEDICVLVSGLQSLEPGKYFDVSLSSLFGSDGYLVRNNGDRVDLNANTFRGKYTVVCCFYVPVATGTESSEAFEDLLNFCFQMYSTRNDFEVVMVAWLNSLVDADDHKKVFDHFFSAFPKSCLAVPFEDPQRRAYLCRFLAGTTSEDFSCSPCLVLDNQGVVMPPFKPDVHHFFGAEAFPFTEEVLEAIKKEDQQLLKGSSLEQLLRVNKFSPDFLCRLCVPQEKVQISALNNRPVGFYLALNGNLLGTLLDVCKQCREDLLDFEIVVLYRGPEPKLHWERNEELLKDLLLKDEYDEYKHWWCLPVDTSVTLRFRRLTWGLCGDRLLVVGPDGELDLYADRVIKSYAVAGHPFTRDSILWRVMRNMREVTLVSVLLGDGVFRGINPDDVISAKNLSSKKVCIFFSSLTNRDVYEKAVASYFVLKQKEPVFEVVYVHAMDGLDMQTISKMPWYVCPFKATRIAFLKQVFKVSEAMIGFGEDGHVCSCRHPSEFTLDDTLYEDAYEAIGYKDFESDSMRVHSYELY